VENARTVASLYARRRRLVLGLQNVERKTAVYRAAIATFAATFLLASLAALETEGIRLKDL